VFCLESYKQAHQIAGKDAYALFNEYRVFNFIEDHYDVLHTTGQQFIIEDIDRYLDSRIIN
jgi:hypothetical protein